MSASLQILGACLALMVVLFIFATPAMELENTAMRAKQFADSILLGLAFLASVLIGRPFLSVLSCAFGRNPAPDTHLRLPSPTPSLLGVFRC